MTPKRDAENRSLSRPDDGFSYPWDRPADSGKPDGAAAGPRGSAQSNDTDTDDIPPFDRLPNNPAPDSGFPDDGLDQVRRAVDETMRERYDGTVQSYRLWFEHLRLKSLSADRAVFACENKFKFKIIVERFRDLISDSLEEVLGYRPRFELEIDPSLAPELAGVIRFGQDPERQEQPQEQPQDEDDDGWDSGTSDSGAGSVLSAGSDAGGFSLIRGQNGREGRIDAAGRLAWDEPCDTPPPPFAGQGASRSGSVPAQSSSGDPYVPGDRPGYMPDPDGSPSRPSPPGRPAPEDLPDYDPNPQIVPPSNRRPAFHDGYTFDNFIVGSSNQLAHAAALSVADNVGLSINPLFIWGPAGLGKTHLMYAIANRAVERDPSLRVICVKGEEFMNELIEAIQRQKNQAFRDKYRKTDMLLIDDIQFIAGKESTQTEFFHTFDALYEDRKQIIITSDRPPKDLTSLENRIRSRFEAGLLVDIQPPDYELRMAILRDKIHQSGMEIPTEVIDFLAKNLQENIRQLEGVVIKLSVAHMVSGCPITMELVLKTVPEYLRNNEPLADTVARIIQTTAAYYSVKPDDVLGKERKKNIQTARNVSMYIVRTVTGASYPQIGVFFYRDHSTVHSNIAKVEAEIADDAVFEANVDAILKEIRR